MEALPGSEEDKQRRRLWKARWRAKHPTYFREYYLARKEYFRKHNSDYVHGHLEESRAYAREYKRKRWAETRKKVIAHYGNKCNCCGIDTLEFLCLDHINGGGAKHKREIGGHIWDWVVKNNFPADFQILCHNCNMAKGFYGSCPHTRNGDQDSK
jgi:predicted HNH restriction endonuclease